MHTMHQLTPLNILVCCLFLLNVPLLQAQSIVTQDGNVYSLDGTEDPRQLNNKGVKLLDESNYTDAISCFKAALHADPSNEVYRTNLAKAYNTYGVKRVEEGYYLEAVFYLSEALDYSTNDREQVQKNLATAYFHLGKHQFAECEIDNAIISYKKGLELDPAQTDLRKQLGLILYNLGVQAFNQRQYPQARTYLEDALQQGAKNAAVYELLGQIEYFQQEVGSAISFVELALQQDDLSQEKRKQLEQRLVKMRKEWREESSLADYRAHKFIIRFDKEHSVHGGYKIREILRSAYRIVGRDFNHFPTVKIPVIVFSSDVFQSKVGGGHYGIRALYDGKIRLPTIDSETDLTTFKSLVWHEYTHALVYELCGPNCPVWLNEGLAQYEENKVKEISTYTIRVAVETGSIIPFDILFTKPKKPAQGYDIGLFYNQSFSMVTFLAKRYQLYKLKRVLAEIKKGKDVQQAFADTLHLTPERFEKQWLRKWERTIQEGRRKKIV